jgi:YihY family inner membrane protein
VSTASAVPETYQLEGTNAKETLENAGRERLIKDSFIRFRAADGLTHTRALAHAAVLTGFPALITIIGLASALNVTTLKKVLEHTLRQLAPGPAGNLLTTAFHQGSKSGGAALVGGLVGALLSGTFAMAQVERGCNRIYGMVRDRNIWAKLGRSLLLSLSAGVLFAIAFVLLAAGGALGDALTQDGSWSATASTVFAFLRWPIGLLLSLTALTLIYKFSPNRRQPAASWLQTGTIMATVLWFVFTALLALYYALNDRLGSTYGRLLGVIAVLTWAYATALAIYLGIAFAAQLEALRAGVPGPRTLRRTNETVRDPQETAGSDQPPPTGIDGTPQPVAARPRSR